MTQQRFRSLVRVCVAALGVGSVLALTACNTVRGVARDVTEVADAFDPDQQ
jgi:predicted small secreted protein